jgi:catechol 2,3-dioxygenase-like lactoylglutathione lyase family enzyme
VKEAKMLKPNGVHHLAVSTADIRGQLDFFTDVLGMELVALYNMHGLKDARHGFVKASASCYIAFVTMPAIAEIPVEIGKTHAGNGGNPSAPGTMQHLALNVDTEGELLAMRDRIRLKGINVIGPINHGFCRSIYFAGPEHLTLEIATSEQGIDAEAWIDPEVVAIAGITPEELERFKHPAPVEAAGGRVAQPPANPAKPHMVMPPDHYRAVLAMSDQEFSAQADYPDPPVKTAAASLVS